MKFFIYILHSQSNGQFYVGQTAHIEKRLKNHNSGNVKSTKWHIPWEIVYTEEFDTRSEAMKREKEIKSKKKRAYIEKLISNKRK